MITVHNVFLTCSIMPETKLLNELKKKIKLLRTERMDVQNGCLFVFGT